MRNRPWVEKFETGEYLRKWNGHEPHVLGCTIYSEYIGIGEDKFFKCVGEFNGIGDVDWWIKEELDKFDEFRGYNQFYESLADYFPAQWRKMMTYGRRNISWSTIAPTGTISLMAGVTSGGEPLYDYYYRRRSGKRNNCSIQSSKLLFRWQ